MRISLVLLFVAVLQLYAETGYAQKTNVSISMSNASIEQVLNKIEETSDYVFLYNDKTINTNRIVSVNNPKGNIIQILNHVFDNTNITYTIVDKQIILSTTQLFSTSQSSGFEVKGIVKDILGEPLIGVNVRVKGTNTGAITDLEGQFTLRVRKGDVIEFSYVGYTSKSLKIEGGGNLSIVLQENAKALEEVVVTALGIKRSEKALSYNVQQVNSDELTTVKDANFVNSLVGKVAGVQINSGANGAGGTSRIIMRGVKSIEKGNNVLYVIDGIPMYNHSFSDNGGAFGGQTGSESSADINPEDIESVNMLTGPSAAALYGSDAANGVILINTKKGVKGHTLVTVTNNTVFSTVQMLPKMQTTYGTSSGLMSWGDNVESNYDAAKFFNTGANIINAVSVSTGNQKNQSYFSASTTNVIGVVPENTYDRYNFAARNTTSFANDKLVLDFGANYIMQTDENMVSQGKYNNPLPALYLFPRGDDFNEIRLYERWNPVLGYMTQYWPYGEGAHSLQNPYWIQNRMKRKSDKSRYMLNASLTWNITDWMNIVGRVRVDNSEYRITKDLYASTLTTFCDTNGGYEDQTQHDKSFYGDVMLNINKTFRDNYSIVVNLGTSINDQSFESAGGAGNLILTNHFAMNNLNYQSKYKSIQSGWHDQIQSIFGSAELGYKSMLYMTVTGRNDWASQLAFSDQASFFYPSVGFSGIITNIFALPKQINYIKVRASYSKVASAFNRFMSNPSYTFNTQTQQWAKPNTSPLDHMRPEDTKSWEFGLNAKLFDNQITLDATFYKSNTYHQTIYGSTSGASLYANQVVQTGNIQNRGIELALGYNKKWGKFDWSSTFTYSLNQNEVKELAAESKNKDGIPEIQKDYLGASSVAPQVILYEGGSMSDIYVKHELARDLNGHILIDPSTGTLKMTETAPKRVGQLAPRYNLGWNNNFSYGNLNVGIVFTARVGGLTYSATQGVLDYYGVSQNSADARNAGGININYGKVEAEKYYQTISTAEGGYGAYYLYSATNVRLQELSLSYTLPREWFNNKAKLSIGFTGKNLCMIFCKAPFDPEISAATGSAYYQGVDYFMQPSTRNLGFNVKLQF